MNDEAFLDTNIIAYSFDNSETRKRKACKRLVKSVYEGELRGFVSNQILAELFVVLTARVGKPLPISKARTIILGFTDSPSWTVANYDHSTVRQAMTDSASIKAPFWDLLIAETMREAGVKRLFTENVRDFAHVPWVEAVNPLLESSKKSAPDIK